LYKKQRLAFAYVVTPTQKDCVGRKTRVIGKIQSNVLGNGFVGYSDIHIIETEQVVQRIRTVSYKRRFQPAQKTKKTKTSEKLYKIMTLTKSPSVLYIDIATEDMVHTHNEKQHQTHVSISVLIGHLTGKVCS
jgi:hypothetical protein